MKDTDSLLDKKQMMEIFSKIFAVKHSTTVTELVDLNINEPEKTFTECLLGNNVYCFNVEFIVRVASGEDKGRVFSVFVNIPKIHQGGFLIKSLDGSVKWRSSIIVGKIKKNIEKYKNRLETSFFSIDFDVKVKGGEGITDYITIYNEDKKNKTKMQLSNYLDKLENGVIEPISLVGKKGNRFKDKYFQLVKKEIDGEYLNSNYIKTIIKLYKDDYQPLSNFSPFDIDFSNQYQTLFYELTSTISFGNIMRKFASKLSKKGFYNGSPLEVEISKFFSMRANENDVIQTASDSNACSLISQTKKVYFVKNGVRKKLNYCEDFLGVVCPLKTPESASLVNIKNEISQDAEIIGEAVYINLFDFEQKENVKIEYRDFYRSRVLCSSNFDYEKNEVCEKNGMITFLYAGGFQTITYDRKIKQFDYVFKSEDSDLAYNSSLIPFLNHTDSVRISMATNMIDQAVPILGASIAPVCTGVEKKIYQLSGMNHKSPCNGVVVGKKGNYIKILSDSGGDIVMTIPPNLKTVAGTYNIYSSTVKVGDVVEKGQVIIKSNSFLENQLATSTPLLVAYDFNGLYGEEDGCLISSSATKLLSHEMEKTFCFSVVKGERCSLNKDKAVDYLSSEKEKEDLKKEVEHLDCYGLPIVGDIFHKGECFCCYSKEDRNAEKSKEEGQDEELDKKFKVVRHFVPTNIEKMEIISVDVFVAQGVTEDGLPIVRNFFENKREEEKEELNKFLDGNKVVKKNEIKVEKDNRIDIRIKVRFFHLADEGAKICNRFGSKCSVVKVYEDDEMPRIGGEDGPKIQLVTLPTTRFNRKNLSSDIESILGLCCLQLFQINNKNIIENKLYEVRKNLKTLYSTDKFDYFSDNEVVEFHNNYSKLGYYQITVKAKNKKYDSKKVKNICNISNVDLDNGVKLYLPKERRMTRNPIVVGFTSIMRLHFLQDHKMTATGKENKNKELVMGIGEYRMSGQKLGEMEGWALLSSGTLEVVEELSGNSIQETIYNKMLVETNMLGLEFVEAEG